jgi:hypothetical protein
MTDIPTFRVVIRTSFADGDYRLSTMSCLMGHNTDNGSERSPSPALNLIRPSSDPTCEIIHNGLIGLLPR